jgi:hypothetical protein
MSASFSDIISSGLHGLIYGEAIDLTFDTAKALPPEISKNYQGAPIFIKTSAIKILDTCIPTKIILLVFGPGEPSDGKCGAINGLMWRIGLEDKLIAINQTITTLAALSLNDDLQALGLTAYFSNLTNSGGTISGVLNVDWEESVAGNRIVIIRQAIPFQVNGRQRVFEKEISVIFGISIKVYVDLYVDVNPTRICYEARARWPGGNAGNSQCQVV